MPQAPADDCSAPIPSRHLERDNRLDAEQAVPICVANAKEIEKYRGVYSHGSRHSSLASGHSTADRHPPRSLHAIGAGNVTFRHIGRNARRVLTIGTYMGADHRRRGRRHRHQPHSAFAW